jgi:hypothetical protein
MSSEQISEDCDSVRAEVPIKFSCGGRLQGIFPPLVVGSSFKLSNSMDWFSCR